MKRTLLPPGLLVGLVLLLTSVLASCGGGPPDAAKVFCNREDLVALLREGVWGLQIVSLPEALRR